MCVSKAIYSRELQLLIINKKSHFESSHLESSQEDTIERVAFDIAGLSFIFKLCPTGLTPTDDEPVDGLFTILVLMPLPDAVVAIG